MKLVFEYIVSDDCTYWNDIVEVFEYESKEDFILSVLYKIDEHKRLCIFEFGETDGGKWYRNGVIKIFDKGTINVGSLEDSIQSRVFELNEWFEKNKRIVL